MAPSTIKFCKMLSAGQDFIVIDARREIGCELPVFAAIACNRYSGVGAEGLLAIENSSLADFKISSFNASGIVGIDDNGVRCAARYISQQQLVPNSVKKFSVETYSQQLQVEIIGKGDRIRINMGQPTFAGHLIPTSALGEQLNKSINVDGTTRQICAVGMGEAHCVVFLTGIDYLDVSNLGSQLEKHVFFPKGCVVDFAEIANPELIKIRVWANGEEVSFAVGHSCCAVAAAAMKLGTTARRLIVRGMAGESEVLWNDNDASIYLTGLAQSVFYGEIDIERYLDEKSESLLN